MESTRPLVRMSVRYGLLAGVLGAVLAVALYFMGKHPFLLPVVFDFRIALFGIFIFFSLKEFRDYTNEGILFFWQGMIGSYLIVLISGSIGGILIGVFGNIHTEFVTEYVNLLLKQMTDFKSVLIENVGQEAYDQQLAKLPGTSAWDLGADYFLKSLIIGTFISIIMSVVMRRQPAETTTSQVR